MVDKIIYTSFATNFHLLSDEILCVYLSHVTKDYPITFGLKSRNITRVFTLFLKVNSTELNGVGSLEVTVRRFELLPITDLFFANPNSTYARLEVGPVCFR
jgi:hypothetical protein